MMPDVTPAHLIRLADQIDHRLGPISGRDADQLAAVLRAAARQWSDVVAADCGKVRHSREETHALRVRLTEMTEGEVVYIRAPVDQPAARDFYRHVNYVAYSIWGAKNYKLVGCTGYVAVVRARDLSMVQRQTIKAGPI